MQRLILVIEDEKAIADIILFNLNGKGYRTLEANDGITGLEMALREKPDLILLDVMLPGMDGFEICRRVRAVSQVPILMLTAREEESDKVLGLEIGADDYITKPFSMPELLARVGANMRRVGPADKVPPAGGEKIAFGSIVLEVDSHNVYKNGELLDLTAREYELLQYLARNLGSPRSREELLEKVWGYSYYGDLRSVDVAVRRLREKIEDNPAEPQYLLTRRGFGYYLRST